MKIIDKIRGKESTVAHDYGYQSRADAYRNLPKVTQQKVDALAVKSYGKKYLSMLKDFLNAGVFKSLYTALYGKVEGLVDYLKKLRVRSASADAVTQVDQDAPSAFDPQKFLSGKTDEIVVEGISVNAEALANYLQLISDADEQNTSDIPDAEVQSQMRK